MFGDYVLEAALPALLILISGLIFARFALKISALWLERSALKSAAKLILSVLRTVLYSLLGLIIAARLGIDVTGVVALAGVLTLAISLSVQNALSNVIGGFTLLYTKPFSCGDFAEIAGQSGVVKEVGLTYTKLVTPDNRIVSIPNSAVVAAQVVNYTACGTRRIEVQITADFKTPAGTVIDALLKAADVKTRLKEKPPFAAVCGYSAQGVSYLLHVWSSADDYWNTLFAVNENVKAVFDAKKIDMAYMYIAVHFRK